MRQFILGDCLEGMKQWPDKHFDLAICDVPYGIGEDGQSNHSRSQRAAATKYTPKGWDKEPPSADYWNELLRVSKNQIVWGANHFISRLPIDSSCWIVWDKLTGGDFADCELAWSSFNTAVRKFTYTWNGFRQGPTCQVVEKRIHPTQKPQALYRWLLQNYAKPGQLILDTHVGSASSLIACEEMGFDYVAYELDADYYKAATKRIMQYRSQLRLFA